MKKLYFSFVFILFFLNAFSQQSKIDSLKFELNKAFLKDNNATKKIKTLYIFCKNQIDKTQIEEFKLYITELFKEAKLQNNHKYNSLGHQLLSDKYRRIGDYDKSLKNSNASIRIAKDKLNDSLRVIFLNQKANVFKFFDKTDSSEVYFQKAIDLGVESKQFRPLGYAYNGMASLKMSIGKYEEAITIQQKCLSIAKKYNIEELEISSLVGLGWLYINNEDYDKSLVNLKKAQNKFITFKISNNKEQLCDIYRFIGLTYSRKGNIEEGNNYNKKALQCLEETDNLMLAADVANTIGANYLRKQQYQKAIPYFEKLIKNTQTLNSKLLENYGIINLSSAYIETNQLYKGEKILLEILNDTIDQEVLSKGLEKIAYQNLSELYNRKKEYKTSLKYLWRFKTLEDSLNTAQKLKEVTEIEAKYQTEQKEKENLELKADNIEQELLTQKANTRNWFLAFGVLASLVLVFFIWKLYKSEAKTKNTISKQKDEIEQQKNLIEKLQREFHHRLKNDFRSINSFIGLIERQFSNDEFNERLNELKNRVTSMFKVHEILLKEDDITQVKAHPYLLELSRNVEEKHKGQNIKLICNIDDTETIMADKAIPFGIVLNEFVTNSYKYAFDKYGGEITIDFKSDKDNLQNSDIVYH